MSDVSVIGRVVVGVTQLERQCLTALVSVVSTDAVRDDVTSTNLAMETLGCQHSKLNCHPHPGSMSGIIVVCFVDRGRFTLWTNMGSPLHPITLQL